MQRLAPLAVGLALSGLAGACASSSLPALPPAQQARPAVDRAAPVEASDAAFMAAGTPTEAYTRVARGVLGCWFGPDGPLKSSHVFQADATPPASGGDAEIVLHERDATLRDQRGVRAYRISFAGQATGARVGIAALRVEAPQAQVMAKDVETWAKGGSGCELRSAMPPPRPVANKAAPAANKRR